MAEQRFIAVATIAVSNKYGLECRGAVCRLRAGAADVGEFRTAIRPVTTAGIFLSVEFVEFAAYYELKDEDVVKAEQMLKQLATSFHESRPRADCRDKYSERGDLLLHVSLDPSRRLVVTSNGPLAKTPVGECLRQAFEQMAAPLDFPLSLRALPDLPITVRLQ